LILGWATGGLFFGVVGDRLGRTRTMALTILIYAGFTGLSGFSRNWEQFALLRFLTGLGIGGEFAAGAALVAETFPDHSRSTALSVVQASSTLGNVAAALINLGMAGRVGGEGWRWMFAIGVIPALLVFVIFLFIKEPQRWTDARALAKTQHSHVGSIFSLFTEPEVRRNTFVGVTLAAVGVIGFWGISTWTPELLRKILNPNNLAELRVTVERQVSYAGMAQNMGGFFGALAFGIVAQRVGRRPAFAMALVGCLVVIPLTFLFTKMFATSLVFFSLMGFVLLFLLGGFTVYFPEIFPTRLRATGTGFCYNVARYVSAPSPSFFGNLSRIYGIEKAALMISSIFILGLLALPFAPETKDKPLPE
jgi:MFS family permease